GGSGDTRSNCENSRRQHFPILGAKRSRKANGGSYCWIARCRRPPLCLENQRQNRIEGHWERLCRNGNDHRVLYQRKTVPLWNADRDGSSPCDANTSRNEIEGGRGRWSFRDVVRSNRRSDSLF